MRYTLRGKFEEVRSSVMKRANAPMAKAAGISALAADVLELVEHVVDEIEKLKEGVKNGE